MLVREILHRIEFGKSAAEADKGLKDYFLITDVFLDLISGNISMVSGEKGTGKSAIYKYLTQESLKMPELNGIDIISAFNLSGEPIFRRLGDESKLTDGQYITMWKMYFLSLVGNWLLKKHKGIFSQKMQRLDALLSSFDMLSSDDNATNVFSKLMIWLRNNATPKAVGIEFGFNEYGIPTVTPKMELGMENAQDKTHPEIIPHRTAFSILNDALHEKKVSVWVVMDRLDEAFIGRPDIEVAALRALVRVFMDLQEFDRISIKLFVRNDLFRKITKDGFVNLTHVSAIKREIIWDDEDLYAMLCQRIRKNDEILRDMGLYRPVDKLAFMALFPPQVNSGGTPNTWKWMLSQIHDGNGISPRNIIDLCLFAKEEQLRKERRTSREFVSGVPLIESESLIKAAARLSKLRVDDTLLAEYGDDVKLSIKAFQNGKSDYTEKTLGELFQISDKLTLGLIINVLSDVGFLEQKDDLFSVPPLYRSGLNITRGKAS